MTEPRDTGKPDRPDGALSRRAALARLGLGAAVAYSAPVVLHLDRRANAKVLPTPCPPRGKGHGRGPRLCRDNDHHDHGRRRRGDHDDDDRRRRDDDDRHNHGRH